MSPATTILAFAVASQYSPRPDPASSSSSSASLQLGKPGLRQENVLMTEHDQIVGRPVDRVIIGLSSRVEAFLDQGSRWSSGWPKQGDARKL